MTSEIDSRESENATAFSDREDKTKESPPLVSPSTPTKSAVQKVRSTFANSQRKQGWRNEDLKVKTALPPGTSNGSGTPVKKVLRTILRSPVTGSNKKKWSSNAGASVIGANTEATPPSTPFVFTRSVSSERGKVHLVVKEGESPRTASTSSFSPTWNDRFSGSSLTETPLSGTATTPPSPPPPPPQSRESSGSPQRGVSQGTSPPPMAVPSKTASTTTTTTTPPTSMTGTPTKPFQTVRKLVQNTSDKLRPHSSGRTAQSAPENQRPFPSVAGVDDRVVSAFLRGGGSGISSTAAAGLKNSKVMNSREDSTMGIAGTDDASVLSGGAWSVMSGGNFTVSSADTVKVSNIAIHSGPDAHSKVGQIKRYKSSGAAPNLTLRSASIASVEFEEAAPEDKYHAQDEQAFPTAVQKSFAGLRKRGTKIKRAIKTTLKSPSVTDRKSPSDENGNSPSRGDNNSASLTARAMRDRFGSEPNVSPLKKKQQQDQQQPHRRRFASEDMHAKSNTMRSKYPRPKETKRTGNQFMIPNQHKPRQPHPRTFRKQTNSRAVTSQVTPTADLIDRDAAIRGYLDGFDSLHLGSARCDSRPSPITDDSNTGPLSRVPSHDSANSERSITSDRSAGGRPTISGARYEPRKMVTDMLRISGGKDPPEMLLEGFTILGEDRWLVRIKEESSASSLSKHSLSRSCNLKGESVDLDVIDSKVVGMRPALVKNLSEPVNLGKGMNDTNDESDDHRENDREESEKGEDEHGINIEEYETDWDMSQPQNLDDDVASAVSAAIDASSPMQENPAMTNNNEPEEHTTPPVPVQDVNSDADVPPSCEQLFLAQMWGKDKAPPKTHGARGIPQPEKNLYKSHSWKGEINEDLYEAEPKKNQDMQYGIIDKRDEENEINDIGDQPVSLGGGFDDIASAASCPYDVDEDIFLISDLTHLQAVHNIAAVPLKNGRFNDALEIFDRIHRSVRELFGPRHNLIGSTLHNIGVIKMWAGKYEDAVETFWDAIRARIESLGPDHPVVAVSLAKAAMAHFALEQMDDALASLEKALHIRRKFLNRNHLEMAKILNCIGVVHYQKQDLLLALESCTSALEIQQLWLKGPIQRESLIYDASVTLSNMGKFYLEREDYDMSFHVYEEALLLQTTSFRKDHKVVLTTLGSLAFAKAKKGKRAKALQIYKGILRSQTAKHGEESREAMETMGLMGVIHIQLCNYREALECLNKVLEWQESNLGSTHSSIKSTKNTMSKVQKALNGEVSVWI